MPKFEIAFTVGCFDMFHQGHYNLIQKMRAYAPSVHVLLHDDYSIFRNKGKFPVQPYDLRAQNLLHFVNAVHEVDSSDPGARIKEFLGLHYEMHNTEGIVFIRGDDWKGFPGHEFLKASRVPVIFVPYTKGQSSTMRRDKL